MGMMSVLALWSAYWAAMFAQVAYLRSLDDGEGVSGFSFLSKSLLVLGAALFLLGRGSVTT
ncbi:hypothetical protein [Methylobacterium sp. 37f]|uniref:hypothetical protein n=1 Tax=Methylobacterium sp. 37f TaxID=2817058 RepID=UPI001FFD7154|nr:hypothetical protein [Methylobacterium sp. 37f]MCK2053790.1 hypothetical protein [Methylobacterium sp. 37f]